MTKNVYNEKQVKDEGAARMSDVYATINYVLVNLINEIWEVEGKAIITDEFKDITNNDMHFPLFPEDAHIRPVDPLCCGTGQHNPFSQDYSQQL